MGNLTLEMEIDAPTEVVFQLITDLEGAEQRIDGIEKIELLTEGPMQEGTRWSETRIVMGRSSTEELEVIRFDPGVGYTAACESCGCRYESAFSCKAKEGGTVLRLSLSWRALTLMAKLMSPLSKMMAGSVRNLLEQDLLDIKKAAESVTE